MTPKMNKKVTEVLEALEELTVEYWHKLEDEELEQLTTAEMLLHRALAKDE